MGGGRSLPATTLPGLPPMPKNEALRRADGADTNQPAVFVLTVVSYSKAGYRKERNSQGIEYDVATETMCTVEEIPQDILDYKWGGDLGKAGDTDYDIATGKPIGSGINHFALVGDISDSNGKIPCGSPRGKSHDHHEHRKDGRWTTVKDNDGCTLFLSQDATVDLVAGDKLMFDQGGRYKANGEYFIPAFEGSSCCSCLANAGPCLNSAGTCVRACTVQ